MKILELKSRPDISGDTKEHMLYTQFQTLLKLLEKKSLTTEVIEYINPRVEEINSFSQEGKELKKLIKNKQSEILRFLEKKLKIVPQKYYQNLWMVLGMSAFGIPIGVALGAGAGNMAMIGAGMPLGMAIGLAVGVGMDKKALAEGRQIEMEIK